MQGINLIPNLSNEAKGRLNKFASMHKRMGGIDISISRIDGDIVYVSANQNRVVGKALTAGEVATRAKEMFSGELPGNLIVKVNE